MIQSPPWHFRALEQDDYRALEHAAYLKGFLRPFKGKGALEVWGGQCLQLRDGLIGLAHNRLLTQARSHPYGLLSAQLSLQETSAGTSFLRWRSPDRSRMGVSLWDKLMNEPTLPVELLAQLAAMERQRIAYNLQMSLLHSIARQAIDGAARMAHAQAVLLRRTTRS
ncbi:MAG: DUF3158 family protein [Proteobacteria bacterium]|nr:DUF3158 family protein [Pseudomonadota bacterium]